MRKYRFSKQKKFWARTNENVEISEGLKYFCLEISKIKNSQKNNFPVNRPLRIDPRCQNLNMTVPLQNRFLCVPLCAE